MTRRVLDLVLGLFPRAFRARHGQQIRSVLDEAFVRENDPARRRQLVRRALIDALGTLPRAWVDALWHATPAPSALARDAAFAVRYRLRRPVGSALLVATLAFALGAATAIASVTYAILLRALPYAEPERVVEVNRGGAYFGSEGIRVHPELAGAPEVEAAAFYLRDGAAALTLEDGRPARRIAVAQVSEDFFRTLGVSFLLGGNLEPGEGDVPDRVVLSHGLWREAFGGDLDVLGRTLRLNDRPLVVAGVAPPEVAFPEATEAWLPMPAWYELYGSAIAPDVLARVRAETMVDPLRARMQALLDAEWAEHAPGEESPTVTLTPLREQLTRGLRTPLLLLAGCAASVLLLACLNLAGIELASLGARMQELRVRSALGASREGLVMQLVTEALVLAAAGGAVALLVASAGVSALAAMLPGETPGLAAAGLDPRTLTLGALLTGVAGLAIGVLPALRAHGRPESAGVSRTATSGRDGRRLQAGLVVAQVALALVLAAGAGLLGRTLARLHQEPLGYDIDGVLTFQVRIPEGRRDGREAWFVAVRERIAALPDVSVLGASTRLPLSTALGIGRTARNADGGGEDGKILTWIEATDGWLEAMGVRRLAGADVPPAFSDEPGVVLSRSAADSLFRGAPAVGGRVQFRGTEGWEEALPVLGVVDDLRLGTPEVPSRGIAFARFQLADDFSFAVRTSGDPADLVPTVRAILAEIDPGLAPYAFRSTGEALAARLAARTAVARLTGLFGAVALVLTSLGLWGLVSRTVEIRRREMGIRLALGASPRALLAGTVRGGLTLGLLGVGLGLAIFLPLTSTFEDLLFGVTPRDPAVLVPIVLLVLAVTAAAAWLPARATLRMDASEALAADV